MARIDPMLRDWHYVDSYGHYVEPNDDEYFPPDTQAAILYIQSDYKPYTLIHTDLICHDNDTWELRFSDAVQLPPEAFLVRFPSPDAAADYVDAVHAGYIRVHHALCDYGGCNRAALGVVECTLTQTDGSVEREYRRACNRHDHYGHDGVGYRTTV